MNNSADLTAAAVSLIARHKDLLLPVALLLVIGTLFVPVPGRILSVLILVNLGISILVLVTSLFIKTPLQLTSYPTILLLTTILRLALSVSITRNILTTGEAGAVVESLGKITAGGDALTGLVMFVIILVVQFIVVGKGSERVAEVAARFTLDAMPGKQMAIDADLRAGLITQEDAKRQRSDLQRESQLHGAMDGAMKFVKNDSIATIVIAIVNIIAGLTVGMLKKGLPFSEAAQKYLILTFGDGLAAIISSLLITVSAGIVVTRVASEETADSSNVGSDIGEQVLSSYKALYITGGILFLLTFVNVYFAFVGLGFGLFGLWLARKNAASSRKNTNESGDLALEVSPNGGPILTHTVPLAIVFSKELTAELAENYESFQNGVLSLRSSVYYDLGVLLPHCHITGNAPLRADEYFIAINEVPVAGGRIPAGSVFVNSSPDSLMLCGIEATAATIPGSNRTGAWIGGTCVDDALEKGFQITTMEDLVLKHLELVMRRFSHNFVGIQEAQGYLDFLAYGMPNLVDEVIGKIITIHQFTDILQRLVREGISIKDTKSILDAISEWGRLEKEPEVLAEYVRAAFSRYISFRYSGGSGSINVWLLDSSIEDVIRAAIRKTAGGHYLTLDPVVSDSIVRSIQDAVETDASNPSGAVILTDLEIRRFVRKLIDVDLPNIAVLSYQELPAELQIKLEGRIRLPEPQINERNYEETLIAADPSRLLT